MCVHSSVDSSPFIQGNTLPRFILGRPYTMKSKKCTKAPCQTSPCSPLLASWPTRCLKHKDCKRAQCRTYIGKQVTFRYVLPISEILATAACLSPDLPWLTSSRSRSLSARVRLSVACQRTCLTFRLCRRRENCHIGEGSSEHYAGVSPAPVSRSILPIGRRLWMSMKLHALK